MNNKWLAHANIKNSVLLNALITRLPAPETTFDEKPTSRPRRNHREESRLAQLTSYDIRDFLLQLILLLTELYFNTSFEKNRLEYHDSGPDNQPTDLSGMYEERDSFIVTR